MIDKETNLVKQTYRDVRWRAAKEWLALHDGVDMIGITGSVGKTTTKEIIYSILSQKFPTISTEKNYDPIFNLPLTALQFRNEQKFVAELGVDGFGQMNKYLDLQVPRIGVITRFSLAHSDEDHFGSLENLIEEKSQLIRSLPNHGWAILNGDDENVAELAKVTQAHVLCIGFDETNDLQISDFKQQMDEKPASEFVLHYGFGEHKFISPLLGKHNALLATLGIAVGMVSGMDMKSIAKGLSDVKAVPGRLYPKYINGRLFIDDTYNASPEAVKAAVEVLTDLAPKRGTLVLGDMLELGDISKTKHDEIGAYAYTQGVNRIYCFGNHAKDTLSGFINAGGINQNATELKSHQEIASMLANDNADIVLVKGSRGTQMEKVLFEFSKI